MFSSTLLALLIALTWSIIRAHWFGDRGMEAPWNGLGLMLSDRRVMACLLLGAGINMSLRAVGSYINPLDYVQDVIAARQFLKHATMYPRDLGQRGIAELSSSMPGKRVLQKLPGIRERFRTLTAPPASVNAHPPLVGILVAAPVVVFGLRGSFLLLLLLFTALLMISLLAIVRELFGSRPWVELCSLMGIVFGWDAAGASLRNLQPSAVILFLLTAGWLLLRRQRECAAGAAIGLAACIHVFPALLILYLAIRYRRAAASAALTVALLSAGVAAVTAPQTFHDWLETLDWVMKVFGPIRPNLSLMGLITGFCSGMGWGWSQRLVGAAVLLVIAGWLVMFLRPWKSRSVDSERLDIEYSMFVVAMLLASPIVWLRYLPVLLLPLAVLIKSWSQESRRRRVPALLLALLFLAIPTQTLNLLHSQLAQILSFPVSWLLTSVQTFSLISIFLWFLGIHRSLPEGTRRDAALAASYAK